MKVIWGLTGLILGAAILGPVGAILGLVLGTMYG